MDFEEFQVFHLFLFCYKVLTMTERGPRHLRLDRCGKNRDHKPAAKCSEEIRQAFANLEYSKSPVHGTWSSEGAAAAGGSPPCESLKVGHGDMVMPSLLLS